jgi:hypothetical protein
MSFFLKKLDSIDDLDICVVSLWCLKRHRDNNSDNFIVSPQHEKKPVAL